MIAGQIHRRIVADRIARVDECLKGIRSLPLDDREAFFADRRNAWAAESCLRRALEALLDIGRHMLAKGFAQGVSEYKEIATQLCEHSILSKKETNVLRTLAGYRNRLVHFYHEVSEDELYTICVEQLGDLELVLEAFRRWLRSHPEMMDDTL